MAIKIKCPSCQKVLNVKDSMAGKRGACPNCKFMLSIPAAAPPASAPPSTPAAPSRPPAAPPPSPPPPAAPPEDTESVIAAMLGDEKKNGPVETPKTVEFNCPMCDEPVKMGVAMAAKQVPCPECRRVIKVPLPKQPDKIDWRQAHNRPAGARADNQPAPEGAWGTTVSRGIVSQESLEEAGALAEDSRPVTVRQWI